jgi:hypothetical protein
LHRLRRLRRRGNGCAHLLRLLARQLCLGGALRRRARLRRIGFVERLQDVVERLVGAQGEAPRQPEGFFQRLRPASVQRRVGRALLLKMGIAERVGDLAVLVEELDEIILHVGDQDDGVIRPRYLETRRTCHRHRPIQPVADRAAIKARGKRGLLFKSHLVLP